MKVLKVSLLTACAFTRGSGDFNSDLISPIVTEMNAEGSFLFALIPLTTSWSVFWYISSVIFRFLVTLFK